MKKILFVILIIICFSCKSNSKHNRIEKVKVVKFMGTVGTINYTITEDLFWNSKEEHANMIISDGDFFLKNVKYLESVQEKPYSDIKYAFIYGKDTIYSDESLQYWRFKHNRVMIYKYDESKQLGNDLRGFFSFFKECW